MSAIYPTLPRLSVRDSFDEDELSDVDDEVFIRDGKTGIRLEDDGVKRPLMAPRRKVKPTRFSEHDKFPYKVLIAPFCYALLALLVLLGLIIICIFTASVFPMPITLLRNWLSHKDIEQNLNDTKVIPCTYLSSKVVWIQMFPKLSSEAPLRSNDVNKDGVEDIIIGFKTGLDTVDTPVEYFCNLYFGGQTPCAGGVIALDGKTGDTVWTYWTSHAIFSVDCTVDLTKDDVKDCVISGRGGILHAVNGHNGAKLWNLPLSEDAQQVLNVYDAKFTPDMDDDDVPDILASHTMQENRKTFSEVVAVSGKTGVVLHKVNLPGTEELLIVPQILVHPDGENYYLLATSSQDNSRGLYIIPQRDFIASTNLNLHLLHRDDGKGVLLPPILVDINADGTEDIVSSMFNSTIVAYDGLSFKQIWNYTVPNSEVISIPVPGYYNNDGIPDFLVKFQIGPGFPVYFYTIATVIDGITGKPLLEEPMEDSLSRQMSGLSVTVDGPGNDWFLHWSADCLDHEGTKERYDFPKSQDDNLMSRTHADICKLRFNTTLTRRLYALSRYVQPPGVSLYYSEDFKSLEFDNSKDLPKETEKCSEKHSEPNLPPIEEPMPMVSERSPRIPAISKSSFRHRDEKNEMNDDSLFLETNEYPKMENNLKLASNAEDDDQESYWRDAAVDKWINEEELQPKKDYDVFYEDEASVPLSDAIVDEIRQQRSEKIFNKSVEENLENQFDPDMDYTNGYRNFREEKIELGDEELASKKAFDASSQEKIGSIEENKKRRHDRKVSYNRIENSWKDLKQLDRKKKAEGTSTSSGGSGFQKDDEADVSKSIEEIFKRESMKNDKGYKRRLKRTNSQVYGVQRQPPTGILLPPLKELPERGSVDFIFSTYWLPPSEISVILKESDLDCIGKKKENRKQYEGKDKTDGEDLFDEDDIVRDCLAERGVNYKKIEEESMDRENRKTSLGQMTVYRMELVCVCPEDMLPTQTCRKIASKQSWPQHLGVNGNGYFSPLRVGETSR